MTNLKNENNSFFVLKFKKKKQNNTHSTYFFIRIFLTNTKDLKNIKKKFGLMGRLHNNEIVSLKANIYSLEEKAQEINFKLLILFFEVEKSQQNLKRFHLI